jgi:hypothetical protein
MRDHLPLVLREHLKQAIFLRGQIEAFAIQRNRARGKIDGETVYRKALSPSLRSLCRRSTTLARANSSVMKNGFTT